MTITPIDPSTTSKLKKLTVPQLRSLCKGRGLTGYSKLTKDAIILKLARLHTTSSLSTNQVRDNAASSSTSAQSPVVNSGDASTLRQVERVALPNEPPSSAVSFNGALRQPLQHTASSVSTADTIGKTDSRGAGSCIPSTAVEEATGFTNKHEVPNDLAAQRPAKVPRMSEDASTAHASSARGLFMLPALPPRLLASETTSRWDADRVRGKETSTHASLSRSSEVSGGSIKPDSAKGFKPLTPAEKTPFIYEKSVVLNPSGPSCPSKPTGCAVFPVDIDLEPISYPPSISERKQTQELGVILSGISAADLLRCNLVSKMFRYAAHLSACHRLRRDFPGKRTEVLIGRYNPNETNMWPYLLRRQEEVSIRKKVYAESFLGKTAENWFAVKESLWTSPDNPKQAMVAVRFILTRFYFLVSIHGASHPDVRRKHVIEDCQQIITDEIWVVSVRSEGVAPKRYYILEPTCEVIGCQDSDGTQQQRVPRADWASYISERMSVDQELTPTILPLFERLKWMNREEYDKGISKFWLKNMNQDNTELSTMKIQIARTYILACVVANSISGKWMSSIEMAQEFAGLPDSGYGKTKHREQIQFYIPEHHYVESVHLTTASKTALHEALAVVQTPGREYYVLRENGMQVGCEEDGVGAVWMSILKCRIDGIPE